MTSRNYEKAQTALTAVKKAVLDEIAANKEGLSNAELVKRLGLASDYEGKNKNYLSWSVLGLLLSEGKITYKGMGQRKRYFFRAP